MREILERYAFWVANRTNAPERGRFARTLLERLALFVAEKHAVAGWLDVTAIHLTEFLQQAATVPTQRGQLPTRHTLQRWTAVLRAFFTWLHQTRQTIANPMAGLLPPSVGQPLPSVPLAEELSRLLETPNPATALGQRDQALLELLYATGLRRSEAAALTLADLDLTAETLLVRCAKNSRSRLLPLTPRAVTALSAYLTTARLLLIQRRQPPPATLWVGQWGRPLTAAGIHGVVQRHAATAGLRLSAHRLRHACATHLLQGGASVEAVQRLLGHERATTTQDYTQVTLTDLRAVIRKLS